VHDALVLQTRGGTRFADETLARDVVSDRARREELERDVSAEAMVPRASR
jgi:hypothetical protein